MLRTLLPLLMLSTGCWVDSGGPGPIYTGACNNNGSCELSQSEDSVSCPGDCPPCQAVEVLVDGVNDPNGPSALLKPNDSKTISLIGYKTIRIQLGQAVYQSTTSTIDFSLQGAVTSASRVILNNDRCVVTAPAQGGFLVQVSKDAAFGSFHDVGYWAQTVQGGPGGGAAPGVTAFSLCGFTGYARYIQIVSQDSGATGTLDYVKAHSCDP